MSHLIVLDIGTTRLKGIIYNDQGRILSQHAVAAPSRSPRPGWREIDGEVLWKASVKLLRETVSRSSIKAGDLKCMGLSNQRSTSLLWNGKTGKIMEGALTWQDTRTEALCHQLNQKLRIPLVQKGARLVSDLADLLGIPRGGKRRETLLAARHFSFRSSLSAVHLAWMLDHLPPHVHRESLCFGTLDSWLIYKLTKENLHATDLTNASTTGLYQVFEDQWNSLLLRLLDIPPEILPTVCPSIHHYGQLESDILGASIPLTGVVADQQASQLGLGCLQRGKVKCTIGTGSFVDVVVGPRPLASRSGLFPLAALGGEKENLYLLEGLVGGGGNTIDWAVNQLELAPSVAQTSPLAGSVARQEGLYFIPAFEGLFAPYWDSGAKTLFIGLKRSTTKSHLLRAVVESVGFQIAEVLEAIKRETELTSSRLWIDGGAAANDFLLQWIADLTGFTVLRPQNLLATSWGAAAVAGLGGGIYKNLSDLPLPASKRIFAPQLSKRKRKSLFVGWKKALHRSR